MKNELEDIKLANTDEITTTSYTYEVKQPKSYSQDFFVYTKASDIKKIRNILKQSSKSKFPIHELLLGISTTGLGFFLSLIFSNQEYNKWIYILTVAISIGTFVAYLFSRKTNIVELSDVSKEILQYLENPDEAVQVRKEEIK